MSYRERVSGGGRDDRGSPRGGRDDDRGGRDSGRGSRDDGGRGRDDRGGRDSRDDRGGRDSSRGGGRSSTGFVYRARSADSVSKRAEGSSQFDQYLRSDVKMFKAHDRDNTIRIVPPTWPEAEHYGLDIWVHYNVGPDGQTYLCLHKMKGEPCPICEERAEAARARDDDYAKELEPKRRVLTYVVDRSDEREGLQAWPMPQGTDQDIVKVSVDRASGEVIPLDDPYDGYDVSFSKTGTGIKTRYEGVAIARRSSSLGDERWLEQAIANPLPDVLQYFSYDHIKKEFGGGGGHSSKHDSRDDRPARDDRGGRDRDPGRPGRDDPPPLTWDLVHSLSSRELDDLVANERLNINPNEAKDDEDLADWICEEMGLQRPPPAEPSRGGRVRVESPADPAPSAASSVRERLAGLRGR